MEQLTMPHITDLKSNRCKHQQDGQAPATARNTQQQRSDYNKSDGPRQLANRGDGLAYEQRGRNDD
jgi:hypothetical protein